MKQYKKYVLGGVFACFMAVALMTPAEKSEAFWPFSKAQKENNANYTGAAANAESNKIKPAPSITVVSPNGGETLKAGKSYTIKWKTKGISKKAKTAVLLITTENDLNSVTFIASSTPNNGFYKWKVPATISGNNFKVAINIGFMTDESNGFFSIIGNTEINTLPEIKETSIRNTEGDDSEIKVGDVVSLSAKAFDADNDDLSWTIYWGDGSGMVGACEVDHKQNGKDWIFEAKHSWKEKGIYTIGTTVHDCRTGSDKDAMNINIESI